MEINDELAKTIAKWVMIVFIAGFIGQFGKSLTKYLIEKYRKKKVKKVIHPKKSAKLSKFEKKQQKAEIKRRKKSK